MREHKDIRLFFALWPDAVLRARLQHAADSIVLAHTARRVPIANLHLTLHFIGNVYRDDMACMRRQARLVDAAAFQLSIDRQGYFSKPRVAWLGCSDIPAALADLHGQLGARLQSCGYQPEARPYHPHVTVARKVKSIDADPGFAPMSWRVQNFALVEVQPSADGVQYRVVESWPLH